MSKHEFTGKTTEEAISEGLRKLGCTISDVRVEVLDEGAKGLFGLFGSKQARVRFTMDDTKDELLSSLSSMTLDSFLDRDERREKPARAEQPRAEKPAQPRAEKPAQRAEKPVAAEQPRQKAPQPESENARAADRPQAEGQADRPQTERQAPRPPKPATPRPPRSERAEREHEPVSLDSGFKPIPLERDQEPTLHEPGTTLGRAQHFLSELTRLMSVPVKVDVQADPEGNLFVQMMGDTLGILIGRRGETLDALQYLTSLQVNKDSNDYIRVTLDTENYRAKREDSLCRLAARMATRAYKTGRKVAMEPMNPYERRILHASLQNHPHVTTHSEGEEPNRHVVITLKNDSGAQRRPPRPTSAPQS